MAIFPIHYDVATIISTIINTDLNTAYNGSKK